ncbi:unnamed protein product [Boreogadus saida]
MAQTGMVMEPSSGLRRSGLGRASDAGPPSGARAGTHWLHTSQRRRDQTRDRGVRFVDAGYHGFAAYRNEDMTLHQAGGARTPSLRRPVCTVATEQRVKTVV